jgi:hypothetical protein
MKEDKREILVAYFKRCGIHPKESSSLEDLIMALNVLRAIGDQFAEKNFTQETKL